MFLKYSEEIRRDIYTTNGVESINRLLEKIREVRRIFLVS
jgi:transposase-like protein